METSRRTGVSVNIYLTEFLFHFKENGVSYKQMAGKAIYSSSSNKYQDTYSTA